MPTSDVFSLLRSWIDAAEAFCASEYATWLCVSLATMAFGFFNRRAALPALRAGALASWRLGRWACAKRPEPEAPPADPLMEALRRDLADPSAEWVETPDKVGKGRLLCGHSAVLYGAANVRDVAHNGRSVWADLDSAERVEVEVLAEAALLAAQGRERAARREAALRPARGYGVPAGEVCQTKVPWEAKPAAPPASLPTVEEIERAYDDFRAGAAAPAGPAVLTVSNLPDWPADAVGRAALDPEEAERLAEEYHRQDRRDRKRR